MVRQRRRHQDRIAHWFHGAPSGLLPADLRPGDVRFDWIVEDAYVEVMFLVSFGRQVAPMLPQPPAVVTCEICAECYWLKDAREIGGTRTSRSCPAITVAPKASAHHEPTRGDTPGTRTDRRVPCVRSFAPGGLTERAHDRHALGCERSMPECQSDLRLLQVASSSGGSTSTNRGTCWNSCRTRRPPR